jgi:hypothetical protein
MTLKFIDSNFYFDAKDKERFFDRPAVMAMMSKNKHRAMYRAAATCRKKIQQGLTRAKTNKPSKPGKPPRQRLAGDDGLRKITYNLMPDGDTAQIKVIKWPSRSKDGSTPQPALHEFGGTAMRRKITFGPTRETKWIFDPAQAKQNKRILKQLEYWSRRTDFRKMAIETRRRIFLVSDFTVTETTVAARYPQRSFMQSGLEKYQRSKHFQARVAEILRG